MPIWRPSWPSVELLSRETLYKAAALEQVTHLTDAVQNLKAA